MELLSRITDDLIRRHPNLAICKQDIMAAFIQIEQAVLAGGQILTCGNGGSHADADHIVTELMKSFNKKRALTPAQQAALIKISPDIGEDLSKHLEQAIPAISLCAHGALQSAINNDVGGDYVFAQQIMGYAKPQNILLAISTSGNSQNIVNALITAQALELKTIGLTGATGGKMKAFCDHCIQVPSTHTPDIQELHLPIYHALCYFLEESIF